MGKGMQPAFIQLKWGLMMKKLHVSSLTSQFLEEILIIQQDGFHHLQMFIKLILLEPISNKRMLLEPEWFSGTGEEFMAAQARFLPEQMDANEASLMAEKSAVEFAMDYSFRHVRLEGDAHYTVDTLIDSDEADSPYCTGILQEAKHIWLANMRSMLKMRMSGSLKNRNFLEIPYCLMQFQIIQRFLQLCPKLFNAKQLTHFSNQAPAVRNHLPSKI